VLILIFAALVRSGIAIGAYVVNNPFTIYYEGDTISYYNPAKSLIDTGRFYRSTETPEIFRTPGYSLLLVPGILVGRVELVTVIVQLLLSCLTVLAVFAIGTNLFASQSAGLAASLMYAVDPMSVVYSSFLMSETLFTFLLAIVILGFSKYGGESVIRIMISALAAGCAAYVRPIVYYLPWIIFATLLVWGLVRCNHTKRVISYTCIFLLLYSATTIPWQLRNWVHAGYWGLSPAGLWNLYCVYEPAIVQRSTSEFRIDDGDHSRSCRKCCTDSNGCLNNLKEFPAVFACMKSGVARVIVTNLRQSAQVAMEGLLRFLLSPGTSKVLHLFGLECPEDVKQVKEGKGFLQKRLMYLQEWPAFFFLDLMLGIWLWLTVLLAIRSIFTFQLYRKTEGILIMVTVVYFAIMSSGPIGGARLRHPVMPLVCVLAGAEMLRIVGDIRQKTVTSSVKQ
jgi:hypothetical protein